MINPISKLIVGFQDSLWPGSRRFSDGSIAQNLLSVTDYSVWLLTVVALFTSLISYRIFLKLEPNFAREL